MSFKLPTSQVAAEVTAGSNPIASIKVNQTAQVPTFPSSGTHTFVRILYAAIDPIDYKLAGLPWPLSRLALGTNPIIPAQTFVGRVWKTSDSRFKSGDLVFGMIGGPKKFGTVAGYTLASEPKGIVKVPEGFNRNLAEFAGVGVAALTALQTLKAGDLPFNTRGAQGGKVFINGASGGVGTYTVQMAKHGYGAHVVATCSAANADLVKSLGADEVVDYRSVGKLSTWLKEYAQKNGEFDHVIDNVGNDPDLYWQAHHYLKAHKGRYTQVGGDIAIVAFVTMARKMLTPGFLGGGQRPFEFLGVAPKEEDFNLIGQWMAEGKVRTVVENENFFDIADTKKAYEKLHTGRARGKIVIKVGADHQ